MSHRTVYIVDDNAAFRDSTAWLLEGMMYRVSSFEDPRAAIDRLAQVAPTEEACLLLDIRMPAMSGLDLHDALRTTGIDVPVIYMTGHGDVPLAVSAMEKGAITFLEKPLNQTDLEAALERAFSPAVQCQRRSAADHALAAERRDELNALSTRESEVLRGILEGLSGRAIGEQLFISPKTVEWHRTRLVKKLKVSNIAQLQRVVAAAGVGL